MNKVLNETWNLQSFIDSLVIELDKARDSLAVKALNQPLSYSVKDLSLDLQVFPEYDGDAVSFKTAKPGQEGASKITMQLVSTSDRAIRESSRPMSRVGDGPIQNLPGIDKKKKKALEKIGVRTVNDLKRIQQNNVNVEQVTDGQIDYKNLASIINRSKRKEQPPLVRGVSMAQTAEGNMLTIDGNNLNIFESNKPLAFFNGKAINLSLADETKLVLRLPERVSNQLTEKEEDNKAFDIVHIALDPDTIIKFRIQL